MGVDYYLFDRESRLVFDLGKNGGYWIGEVDMLGEHAPKTIEECRALVHRGWLGDQEMTPNELEAAAAETHEKAWMKFDRDWWVFVEEFGCYIPRTEWSGNNVPIPPLEERIQEHRDSLEFCTRWADDLWAFANDPRIGGDWTKLEVCNDCGDLPWWDYDGRAWLQIGSRYDEDRGKTLRLDMPPKSTITNKRLSPAEIEAWRTRLGLGQKKP